MSYFVPDSLSDALDIMAQSSGTVVAGGTDLYPSAQQGQGPSVFVDITRVGELGSISQDDTEVVIGAGVTWSQLVACDLPPAFDALKEAAREVGSIQIQNAGTLVGNLCNASPAADGVPALLALGASVRICSAARGVRTVRLADFITGVRQKDLAADEIVAAICIPTPADGMRSAFEKLGSRRYLVISICMAAANIRLDSSGRIADASIAVGACSAVAQRLEGLEADILGQSPAQISILPHHLACLSPIDDVRGSAAYRMDVVRALVLRSIARAATT